jgi:integrase
MGTLITRSGILYLDFRFKNQRCREVSRLPDTSQNRKRCDALLKRIEAEIVLGTFDYAAYFPDGGKVDVFRRLEQRVASARSGTPNFGEFAKVWFEERKVEWRRTYITTMRTSVDKYLLPEFGSLALDLITKADIMAFRAKLTAMPGRSQDKPLSAIRVNKIMMVLHMILTEGSERFDFDSPWKNIKSLKEKKSEVDPFTLNEVNMFIERVRPDMRNYYITRFFSGMRSSEIDGLKWRYVDFDRRQIMVREALVQGRIEPTKTDGSSRDIEMNHLVFEALHRQREVSAKFSEFVFCMRTGNPLINRNVTGRVWYPTLANLGFRPRRPYQTRHTAATLWLASGENPEWIARQMGHSSTEMLFRVYSRYVPNLTRKDGSAFEQLLRAKFG